MDKPSIGDIVKCLWRDAYTLAKEEQTQEEVDSSNSYTFTTYGILARDDRGQTKKDPLVAIATESGEDGRYRGVTYIPAEMVISLESVKAKRKPRKRVSKELPPSP